MLSQNKFKVKEAVMANGDMVDKIMTYEEGGMSEEEMVAFFQELIDSGIVWKLQGTYGRTAKDLIDSGRCHSAGGNPPSPVVGNYTEPPMEARRGKLTEAQKLLGMLRDVEG